MAYVMLTDSLIEPKAKAGTTVHSLRGYDYGLAADDTQITGHQHISVTLNEDGTYPSFTVRRDQIKTQE